MCAKITFFRTPEHRVYNYTPRYYDPRKERLEELYKKYGKTPEGMQRAEEEFKAEERAQGRIDHYVPGQLIRGAFSKALYENRGQKESKSKLKYLIGFVTIIAAMLVAIYLAEGFVKLLQ